jgi:hypothetical protein
MRRSRDGRCRRQTEPNELLEGSRRPLTALRVVRELGHIIESRISDRADKA